MHAFDVFAHGAVDRLAVAHVGDIDHDLDQMVHVTARFFDQLANVLHDLVGLLHRIMATDILRRIKVLRALAAQVKRAPPTRGNGLTQVIVKVLLGVFGVELAVAGMGVGHGVLGGGFCRFWGMGCGRLCEGNTQVLAQDDKAIAKR